MFPEAVLLDELLKHFSSLMLRKSMKRKGRVEKLEIKFQLRRK